MKLWKNMFHLSLIKCLKKYYSKYFTIRKDIGKMKTRNKVNLVNYFIQLNETFHEPPQVLLSYNLGMREIQTSFSLPLLITKYLEPYDTPIDNFTPLWYEISNSDSNDTGRLDSIMFNPMASSGKSISKVLTTLLTSTQQGTICSFLLPENGLKTK